jgi:hypothetical protein
MEETMKFYSVYNRKRKRRERERRAKREREMMMVVMNLPLLPKFLVIPGCSVKIIFFPNSYVALTTWLVVHHIIVTSNTSLF